MPQSGLVPETDRYRSDSAKPEAARRDNSNSAQKAINQEVNKMAKSDVESKVYTEFNEQFQAIAWVILLLLLAEILILDRKNPLFKNIHLFSNKK